MLGKTHFVVGITTGLAVFHPKTLPELLLGTAASALGGVISDIDIGTSDSHKDSDRILAAMLGVAAAVVAADYYLDTNIYARLLADSGAMRLVGGVTAFLLICCYGKAQPHRGFMHSFAALFMLCVCAAVICPAAVPYFGAAYLSHLVLDLLNKKGEQLFWPQKKRLHAASLFLFGLHFWTVGLNAEIPLQ